MKNSDCLDEEGKDKAEMWWSKRMNEKQQESNISKVIKARQRTHGTVCSVVAGEKSRCWNPFRQRSCNYFYTFWHENWKISHCQYVKYLFL